MSIVSRIEKLCKKENITFAELERRIGLTRGSIARFDKNCPSSEKITKVAQYFGITTDYLLGLSDNPFPQEVKDMDIISLQRARKNMTQKDKERMMNMLKAAFDYAFNEDNEGDDDNR